MISQTAEYALRAVVDLAYHEGESRTAQQIAHATRIPTGYLAKVLQDLSRHNVVRSQRGLHGGYALARSPEQITMYDVLNAVDPLQRIHKCPLGLASHNIELCPLHRKLDAAMAGVEDSFRSTTIAQITADPEIKPLREKKAALTVSGGLAVAPPMQRRRKRR